MSTNDATDFLPQIEARPAPTATADPSPDITERRWFLMGVFCGLSAICVGFWAAFAAVVSSAL